MKPRQPRSLLLHAMGVAVVLLSAACNRADRDPSPAAMAEETGPPSWVGSEKCGECHAPEYDLWLGSHHDLAMQVADESTILADYESRPTFGHRGIDSRFERRDDGLWVRTDGEDGTLQEFRIAYTFGVEPLQQYLVEFPGGRLQALPLAWDTRPEDEGGQRWFHLQPDEEIPAGDVLHWTGPNQNWNFMCAACHSTALEKNYDPTTGEYSTTWEQIDVGCEACHGAGSHHVAQAEAGDWDEDALRPAPPPAWCP